MPQTREPRETRLVSEWLAREYPGEAVKTNLRVGVLPEIPEIPDLTWRERRALSPVRRYVDAAVFRDSEVILIEATIRADPGKLGQLMLYRDALPHTPELVKWRSCPVRAVLLSGIDDEFLRRVTEQADMRFEVYQPAWLLEYLLTLRIRDRTAGRASY